MVVKERGITVRKYAVLVSSARVENEGFSLLNFVFASLVLPAEIKGKNWEWGGRNSIRPHQSAAIAEPGTCPRRKQHLRLQYEKAIVSEIVAYSRPS
ncbi:hypothetical protein CEXT_660161 [Caerostris extrusa]|uniref:Uncharacterized protein n=1 Tax=Caerostris extrusa TaxID=172846 RepID=A0AAV4N808_CAEEX|nr:hypothetical protein CEXT_660161 [Caerostris extrusa]